MLLKTSDDEVFERLNKDLKAAARTLSDAEARFLVDSYYRMQDGRKRAGSQLTALEKAKEPNEMLQWFEAKSKFLEDQLKTSLGLYADSRPIGRWLLDVYGIGPVLAAGLIAHIDIKKAPTAGHIWRFAGLDPTVKWEKRTKRPWNAALKVLCWKVGKSFTYFSKRPECRYGHLYLERKEYEIKNNDEGKNRELALSLVPKFSKTTEAYGHLVTGKLPPAQIDARARRWAVKIFLSHLQEVWYTLEYGKKPPAPFAIAILGHAHKIEPQK